MVVPASRLDNKPGSVWNRSEATAKTGESAVKLQI